MTTLKDLELGCEIAGRTLRTLRSKLHPSIATEGRSRLEYEMLGLALDAIRVTKLLLMHNPDVGMPVADLENIEAKARWLRESMAVREQTYQTSGRFNR